MNTGKTDNEKISFKDKFRRWVGKYFRSDENCNSQCANCVHCPYTSDSKYTFEIKKRE